MPVCPYCFTREMIKHGIYNNRQRWYCMKCKRTTTAPRLRTPKQKGVITMTKTKYRKDEMTKTEMIALVIKKTERASSMVKSGLYPSLKYMSKTELLRYLNKAKVTRGGDISLI